MSVSTYEIGLEGLDALTGVDALCLFVAEDDRPLPGTAGYVDWRLCGSLSRVLKGGFFTGVKEDWLLLPTDGRMPMGRIFAVGLGTRKNLDTATLRRVLANAAQVLAKANVESVALELPFGGKVDEAAQAEALQQHFLPGFKGKRVTVLADKSLAKLLPVKKS
ncbi:M17 family peptidase N-terminal domain-containing protein [Hyalangium minutum]|uniref:Cytosol aminopeptidase N-terminal domain protein n=1 Tax=Hyalangium minutum TaxID=394096 RepID=A0A085WH56_9BACT|nr:M17 family peptidase N-terminal domain-containing protein [Hyalangium minutum]KFE67019.1 cytosol aminopeptidase N-terminal domain protein [Hyalangium minutum]